MMTPAVCNAVGAVVLVFVALFAGFTSTQHTLPTYTRRVYACTTYTVLLMLWPMLFGCLVGFELIQQVPLLALSLIWPYALVSLNVAYAHRSRDERVHNRASVQMDVNALSGFCFAIGALIASQLGKNTAMCTSSIFSTAFILCLAFVMPSPEVPDDHNFSVVIESMQQVMLHMAIALLLAGIIINLSVSVCLTRRSPNMLRDLLAKHVTEAPSEGASDSLRTH